MTIASEITRINGNIAAAYTAAGNKGATMPVTQNSTNQATCIGTISGGGYSEFPSYQVSNGVASRRSGVLTGTEFSGISSVGDYGLQYAFYGCSDLTGTFDLSSLTSVGGSGLNNAFYGCSGLTSVDLSSLTSVGGSGLQYAFRGCTKLTSVDFSSLKTITGNNSLRYLFYGCTAITDVYFRALTTTSFGNVNAFTNMMQSTGTTVTHTIHFPSNLQSTISGLTGYPLFGGTSGYVVCAFDLPATS